MMQPANGNGEFIAHLASHGPLLCELNVVSVGWRAAADETRLRSHEFKMFAITLAHRLADDNHRLSAWFVPLRSAVMVRGPLTLQFESRRGLTELLGVKSVLDGLGIGSGELVLEG